MRLRPSGQDLCQPGANNEGGYAPNFTPLAVNEMTNGFIVKANMMIGNVEHLNVITTVDTISETYAVEIDALMADSAFATGPNISGLEERGIEFLLPLSEVKCEYNPALRDDPTVPVAADDVKRLPINPQCRKNPNGEPGRKLTRDEYETARERHSERMSRPESSAACNARLI